MAVFLSHFDERYLIFADGILLINESEIVKF